MKKIYFAIIVIATVLLALMLSSCACKHEFGEWQETKAPTCKDYGTSERVCAKCGEVDSKMLQPTDSHVYGDWETTEKATCIGLGIETRTCSVCEKTEERGLPIDIGAHVFGEWVETKAPTCSKNGAKERTCTLCETKENAVVPKLENGGHSFGEWKISIEPTCSAEGQRVKFCAYCEKPEYETLSPLDKGGHSYGEWYTVSEPTCVSEGTEARDCVYCDNKEERAIPVNEDAHSFGDWEVSVEPTCSTKGERKRQCEYCKIFDVEETAPLDEGGHAFGAWQTTVKPSCESEGKEARECVLCGIIETNVLPKLPIVYTITLDIDGEKRVVNLPEDGIYSLDAPTKLGYDFVAWYEGENEFAASGKISESKEISARFEVAPTLTFNELKTRLEGGCDKILLSADIEITDTVYVLGQTVITSNGDYTLTRGADFYGDIFVLGEDENGRNTILSGKFPSLTLKPEGGTVTIDGNRDNVSGTVHGTVFFMLNGTTLNIYDGVTVKNNLKLSNERALNTKYALNGEPLIGGSVMIIDDGVFNMYGGEISGNAVNLKYSSATPEEERVEGYRDSSYGGAIYSIGAINIYGGKISDNEASYGGAIFTSRTFNIEGGTFEGNHASSYGGALFGSNNGSGIHYIGSPNGDKKEISVVFRGNTAKGGGAIYHQYNNATVIYGNTLFEENQALGKMGGAIFTGGELIIYYAEFKNNIAADRGGALYGTYSAADKAVRVIDIKEAIFEGNSAARGGAIAASATQDAEDTGAIFELGNVTFKNNTAFKTEHSTPTFIDNCDREGVSRNYNGNGAVAHFTAKCEIHFGGRVVFEGNAAESKGGALYLTNQAKLKSIDGSSLLFKDNQSAGYGGAIYLTNASSATLFDVEFISNKAQSGGALALFASSAVSLCDVTASANEASGAGGFARAELSELEISSSKIESSIKNNTSKNSSAGAFYLEGAVLELKGNENTGILIEGNTSDAQGGVVCAYIGSREITVTNAETGEETTETESVRSTVNASYVTFKSNVANAPEQYGGGAIYASNTDLVIENSSFDSNSAVYGGAVSLYSGSEFKAINTVFTNNTAKANGGVMYTSKSNAIFENVTVNGNSATGYTKTETTTNEETGEQTTTEKYVNGQGGAFFFNSTSTATFTGVSASINSADVGGVVFVAYSTVTVNGEENAFSENTAITNGGAFYLSSDSSLTLEFISATKNQAENGGFIYADEATLIKISGEGNVISENKATSEANQYGAGAIYIYKTETQIFGVTFEKNTGNCGGAIGVRGSNLEISGCIFKDNSGTGTGGTIYVNTSDVTLDGCTVSGSVSGGNGGAIYSTTSTVNTSNTVFENNSCGSNYGGVIYLTKTSYTSVDDTFKGNTSKHGGAVAVNSNSSFVVSGAEFANNTSSANGGAIWVGGTSLEITESVIKGNEASLGGGIYVTGASTTVIGNDIEISQNIANENSLDGYGGGIYITNGAQVTLTDLTINQNKAANGGAIGVLNGASLTVNGISASGNEAHGYTVDGVTSGGNGGVIHAGAVKATDEIVGAKSITIGKGTKITSNTFVGNSANNGGGAIYIYNTETAFTANEIVASGNEATKNYGGALYIRGASITVNIGTIESSDNHAGSNGGAVYLYAFKGGKIDKLTANGNTTNTSGGALYIAGSAEVTIGELYGSGNTATTDGGYAYIGTSTVIINGGEIGDSNDANGYSLYLGYKVSINTSKFTYPEGELFEKKAGNLVEITG
ncbi:MAG: hypothetical protein J6A90_02290 [Clostridia bacterium]|nr:hypothetical protein [Clostridia bacterium]